MRIRATRCFQTKNAQSSKQSIGVEGRVLRVIVRDVFDLQHILHVFKNHKRGNKGKKKRTMEMINDLGSAHGQR